MILPHLDFLYNHIFSPCSPVKLRVCLHTCQPLLSKVIGLRRLLVLILEDQWAICLLAMHIGPTTIDNKLIPLYTLVGTWRVPTNATLLIYNMKITTPFIVFSTIIVLSFVEYRHLKA